MRGCGRDLWRRCWLPSHHCSLNSSHASRSATCIARFVAMECFALIGYRNETASEPLPRRGDGSRIILVQHHAQIIVRPPDDCGRQGIHKAIGVLACSAIPAANLIRRRGIPRPQTGPVRSLPEAPSGQAIDSGTFLPQRPPGAAAYLPDLTHIQESGVPVSPDFTKSSTVCGPLQWRKATALLAP
jgi:hypothetical protein